MSMRLLALDTATEACSVALFTDGGTLGRWAEVGRGHAELILAMVDEVLAEAGLPLGALDGVAVSIGPGAFTGVRIGVSVGQGLAFGAGLPVIGVSTLDALALQAVRGGARQVLACLDARMGEVYWAAYASDTRRGLGVLTSPRVGAPGAVVAPAGGAQGIGRGFAAYAALGALPGIVLPAGASTALPDARDMATLGALRLAAGEGVDPAALTPLYLRDKVALTELERSAAREAPP